MRKIANVRSEMVRVVVIGTSCAGKTTFARMVANALALPYIELDSLFWQPNWVPRPREEFRELTAEALSQDCWITDGNYSAVRDLVWPKATTVIWLNYSFVIVLWRGVMRTVRRVLTREKLFSGNQESFRMAFFSRESILWWIITTFQARRKQYRKLFLGDQFPHLDYVEFRKPSEAERFLAGLKATSWVANESQP